jgi:ABC-type bacteriocin/lantibiotic exporter with double-glycine peptidase domain
MVSTYLGKPLSIERAKSLAHTHWLTYKGQEVGMTLPDMIQRTLSISGIPSKLECGTLDKIKYHISKNRPPIVLLRSGEKTWHYVVVIGYTENIVVIADPYSGNRRELSNEYFVNAWRFTHDMEGNRITHDSIKEIVLMTGISVQTYIIPNYRNYL